MAERLALGIDIGGTKIAFALVDEAGQVHDTLRIPTLPAEGPDAVMDRIAAGIRTLRKRSAQPVAGAGIGCPGHIDPLAGMARNAVNLGWRDVPLIDGLRARLGDALPLWLHNDGKAETLGELYFGAARGCTDFVYLAIGTGLGAGAVTGGELVTGSNAFAMELGHVVLDPGGRLCACGQRGCVETFLSGNGLMLGVAAHRAEYPDSPLAQSPAPTTEAVLGAARAGDPLATVVIEEARRWLTTTLLYCTAVFNPQMFVIGGGLGHAASDLLLDGVEAALKSGTLDEAHAGLQIVMAQVTHSAVGAASLVWHGLRARRAAN